MEQNAKPLMVLGTASGGGDGLRQEIQEQLRGLDRRQLLLVKNFISWTQGQVL